MRKRYGNFDLLRLFLALEVVVLHCLEIPQGHLRVVLPIPPVAGFVCLSGLLIPGSFTNSRNWGHFAWKRVLRVVPAFALSFVVVFALFGPSRLWQTLFVYLTAGLINMPGSANGSLWSLMLEELLYLQHCLSRSIKGLWSARTAWVSLGASLIVWALLRHGVHGYRPGFAPDMQMGPVCAFFAGCAASFHQERIRSWRWPGVLFGLILGTAALYWVPALAVPIVPLTCFLAVAFAYCAPQVDWRLPDLSYGLYIYATPILLWAAFVRHWTVWPVLAFTLAACTALCLLSWYLLEAPALRLKDWRPGPKDEPLPLEPAQA